LGRGMGRTDFVASSAVDAAGNLDQVAR